LNEIDENEMILRNREKFYQIQIDRLERALAQATTELQSMIGKCKNCYEDEE